MKREKRVYVFSDYGLDLESLPDSPKLFMKYWEEKFEDIPQEYRENAKIFFSVGHEYKTSVLIFYTRDETDEEWKEAEEEKRKQFAETEKNELEQLERLKKKYGV